MTVFVASHLNVRWLWETGETHEQSGKLKVHEKDINKFGKLRSLTATCLHKNDVWQIDVHRLREGVHDLLDYLDSRVLTWEGITIWEGPIMPLLTFMFVQVLKTHVPYIFAMKFFGLTALNTFQVPRLFSSSDARKSANSSYALFFFGEYQG